MERYAAISCKNTNIQENVLLNSCWLMDRNEEDYCENEFLY